MTEIVCTLITSIGAIIIAAIGYDVKKRNKKEEILSKKRLEESHLQLSMISANAALTIGVALAIKNGHCNGEVEQGLKEVREARANYRKFLEEQGLDSLN